jgi:ankyrin repeat protein
MWEACVLAMIAVAAMAQDPEKFYSAIRENNLTQLNALLDQKASAAVADNRGITALMYAAEIGSVDAMRLLIDRGADVNARNAFGSTALMWSVSDQAKVRLLLEHGADVNTAAKSGPAPGTSPAALRNSRSILRAASRTGPISGSRPWRQAGPRLPWLCRSSVDGYPPTYWRGGKRLSRYRSK